MKAKHLLLTGALLFCGATSAMASSVTVEFTGVSDAYKLVTVMDEDETETTPTSASYKIEYEGDTDLWMTVESGYKMKLVCETSGIPGTYNIEDQGKMMGVEAGQFYMLSLTDDCDGATFSCEVEQLVSASATIKFVGADGLTNPYEYLTAKEKSGSKETPITISSETLTTPFSGSALLIFDAKEGYVLDIVCDNPDLKNQFNSGDYNTIDVGSRNPALFTPGTHWELYLYAGAAGATFTCTVKKAAAPEPEPEPQYSATINFVGANNLKDAFKYVTVNKLEDEGEKIGEAIPVESGSLVLTYDDFCDVLVSAKENCTITLTCDDADLKNNQDYSITFYGSIDDFGKQFILSVFENSNGASFTCMVSKSEDEPEPTAENSVTINIVGANGLADAYKYVTVEDEDENEYPVTPSKCVLEYEKEAEVGIYCPKGYLLNIVCDNDALDSEEDFMLEDVSSYFSDYGSFWQLLVTENANGATFTCTVTKEGEDPQPTHENSVTINFTGVENAYKYVSIMDEDENDIEVDSAAFVLEYDEETEVLISVADGYTLSIVCDDDMLINEYGSGDYFLADYNPSYNPGKEWDLAVYEGANGTTFTATVSLSSVGINATVAEDNVTVYNLLGVKVLEKSNPANVKTLEPGLYIINGKKVNILK